MKTSVRQLLGYHIPPRQRFGVRCPTCEGQHSHAEECTQRDFQLLVWGFEWPPIDASAFKEYEQVVARIEQEFSKVILGTLLCKHERLRAEVMDQTLGIVCRDCGLTLGVCWADEHASEALWNRAAAQDPTLTACEQSRTNFCFLCGEHFAPQLIRPGSAE